MISVGIPIISIHLNNSSLFTTSKAVLRSSLPSTKYLSLSGALAISGCCANPAVIVLLHYLLHFERLENTIWTSFSCPPPHSGLNWNKMCNFCQITTKVLKINKITQICTKCTNFTSILSALMIFCLGILLFSFNKSSLICLIIESVCA